MQTDRVGRKKQRRCGRAEVTEEMLLPKKE